MAWQLSGNNLLEVCPKISARVQSKNSEKMPQPNPRPVPDVDIFWQKIYFLRYFDGSSDNKKSFLYNILWNWLYNFIFGGNMWRKVEINTV